MDTLNKLIYKINACVDYQTLYSMEDDFNKAGLTIQTTSSNRVILCKIKNNKACTDSIIDDYIFIGSINEGSKELTDRTVAKICDFVTNAAGKSSTIKNVPRAWRNGLKMYSSNIAIFNEDVNYIGDIICD